MTPETDNGIISSGKQWQWYGHAHSDCGKVREHNEDAVYCDPACRFAIVADGMGGAQAGEVASAMAVERLRAALEAAFERADISEKDLLNTLHSAVENTHDNIAHSAANNSAHRGMGTTLVVWLRWQQRVHVLHVGDSRAYRFYQGKWQLLTRDHSLVQQQFDQGLISAEEKSRSPLRNVITQALGVKLGTDLDCVALDVRERDLYLLCSDGLHDLLDDEVLQQLSTTEEPDLAVTSQRLIDAANQAGGHDNISAVLLCYGMKNNGMKNNSVKTAPTPDSLWQKLQFWRKT